MHVCSLIVDVYRLQEDENVEELDKLRIHAGPSSKHLTEQLEDSLKKLHDTNPHHKAHEEKPVKVKEKVISSKRN